MIIASEAVYQLLVDADMVSTALGTDVPHIVIGGFKDVTGHQSTELSLLDSAPLTVIRPQDPNCSNLLEIQGFQLLCRDPHYDTGYKTMREIREYLASIRLVTATFNATTFQVSLVGTGNRGVILLGKDSKKRHRFSWNGSITLREL